MTSCLLAYLALQIILSECLRRGSRPDLMSMANFWFFVSFVLVPLLRQSGSGEDTGSVVEHHVDVSLACAAIAHLAMVAGWSFVRVDRAYTIASVHSSREGSGLAAVTVVSASLSVLYLLSYGGIAAALSTRSFERFTGTEQTIPSLSFLAPILGLPQVVLAVILAANLSPNPASRRERRGRSILLAVNGFLVLIGGVQSGSRGALAGCLMSIGVLLVRARRLSVAGASAAIALALSVMLFGKPLLFGISSAARGDGFMPAFSELLDVRMSEASGDSIHFVSRDFVHPLHSLSFALATRVGGMEHTFFNDFPKSMIRLIPQRLRGEGKDDAPDTISRLNTRTVLGFDVASYPPGIVAHCYYAMGWSGVLLGMFVFGAIGRMTDAWLVSWSSADPRASGLYAVIAVSYGAFVTNGDPHVFFYEFLAIGIATMALGTRGGWRAWCRTWPRSRHRSVDVATPGSV
jgi:hypothetical protein